MTNDLIARLKAAHEALGPTNVSSEFDQELWDFACLLMDNYDEIIEALEERERLRELVEAGARVRLNPSSPLEHLDWERLDAALDALEKK